MILRRRTSIDVTRLSSIPIGRVQVSVPYKKSGTKVQRFLPFFGPTIPICLASAPRPSPVAPLRPRFLGQRDAPVDPAGMNIHDHRLGLDYLPLVVHQEPLRGGLGVPGLGEDLLYRLGVGVLLATGSALR